MKLGSYDLHCHSTCSDGSLSEIELLDLAKKEGLRGISITDHDTVAAYSEETMSYAKKIGIELVTGVEFSSIYQKREGSLSIHILGYGIDIHHPKVIALQNLHESRRNERFEQILEKLKLGGFDLSDIKFPTDKKGTIGRPHIALALIEKGYVEDMKEAFKKFLGERAPYFVPTKLPSIEETIATIKIAGGRAILAHPILVKGRKILRALLANYQFDGMECFYGNFTRDRIEFLLKMCEQKNLLITGGSDFHGENRTFVSLGSSFTTEESVRRLLSR